MESTIADMMGNQQSRMDAITAIMVEEEAARKEAFEFESYNSEAEIVSVYAYQS